jgi:hypothetical protein
MKIPFQARIAAAVAAAQSRSFAIGWANGVVRWHGRFISKGVLCVVGSPFSRGSVKHAASEAAITFMRECSNADDARN